MLWNRRKSAEMPAVGASPSAGSGYRRADADRGLDGLGNLLKRYGRFAFDTDASSAVEIGLLLADRPWLLVLTVDQLASVSQRFGQPLADDILRQVSNVLTRTFLRKQDFVAR